jgi:hypothetical protein
MVSSERASNVTRFDTRTFEEGLGSGHGSLLEDFSGSVSREIEMILPLDKRTLFSF